ncbi:MAG: hypothetical protein IPK13_15975 [Deltaproteobacteria bacterium]|nr:hypothetical protein [Deltaproteobacteria bacterium]
MPSSVSSASPGQAAPTRSLDPSGNGLRTTQIDLSGSVLNVNFVPQGYEHAADRINKSKRRDDGEDLADTVIDHPGEVQYLTLKEKKDVVQKILTADWGGDEAKALLKILESLSDPFELAYVFGDCSGLMNPSRLGGNAAACAKVESLNSQFDAKATGDAIEEAITGLYEVKNLLADPDLDPAERAKLIALCGSEADVAHAISVLEHYADNIDSINTMEALREVQAAATAANRVIRRCDQELPGRRVSTSDSGEVSSESGTSDIDDRIAEGESAAKDSKERETKLLQSETRTLLEMLRGGSLKAEDLTPAVQLKIQDEMQRESAAFSLSSNISRLFHDMIMTSIHNIKA